MSQGFGFGPDIWWGDAVAGVGGYESNDDEVVTVTAAAPLTRAAGELAARVKAAGGKLSVSGNDSAMLVALNNQLRFSVTYKRDGYYEIQDRLGETSNLLLIGGAIALVVLVVVIAGK